MINLDKMRMSKTKKVLLHILEEETITSWEAIKEYGATRLSAIIYNLRHRYKLNIITEKVVFTDRFGDKSSFAKYIYIGDKE